MPMSQRPPGQPKTSLAVCLVLLLDEPPLPTRIWTATAQISA